MDIEKNPEINNEVLNKHYSKKTPLTQDEAQLRSFLVRDDNGNYEVRYSTFLVLRRKADENSTFPNSSYDGKCEVFFTFYQRPRVNTNPLTENDFFLNFIGEIKSFQINDVEQPLNYFNHRIFISPNLLNNNAINKVTILYSSRYAQNGAGLHHYTDPSDSKEYLYTQFESFECHKVFPCFDQPDIKAKLKLYLLTPNEWTVLSNEYEDLSTRDAGIPLSQDFDGLTNTMSKADLKLTNSEAEFLFKKNGLENKNYSFHEFIETYKISPYLYAICAGPYHKITCPFETEVPLNIYLRQSLKNYGKITEFFKVTNAGMNFYKSYFGIAYPFRKYDQIFCPEYNWGAMENVGLVTYNEFFCFKDPPTKKAMTGFLITVLHELAHMWFGNLVTMEWWDDLWLNESFATFISHLCLAKIPEFKEYEEMSWLLFNSGKGYAYKADQQSTTHPVMSTVKSTEVAETHFDEIVYEKGSAILKQIFYLISDNQFSQGLKNYFKEYSWKNTTFSNFISKMSELEYCKNLKELYNIKSDLTELCEFHLKKSGLNEIELKMDVDSNAGKITSFELIQNPCLKEQLHANRQTHLIEILFLNNFQDIEAKENLIFKNTMIHPQEFSSHDKFIGLEAPKAVILNYNDWGYFKWIIDRRSIENLKDQLVLLKDNLTKALVYRSLFDMIRDCRISAFEYIEMTIKFLTSETSETSIVNLLTNLKSAISNYVPLRFFEEQSKKIFQIVLQMLKEQLKLFNENSPIASKDLILNLILKLFSFACNEEHLLLFSTWLENDAKEIHIEEVKFPDDIINLDHKFQMVQIIFESRKIPLETKEKLLNKQIESDQNSDRSVLAKLYCYAVRPDRLVKEELWNKFVNESKSDSLFNLESMLSGFAPISQIDLIEDFLKHKFFEVAEKVGQENEGFYIPSFVACVGPIYFAEDHIIQKLYDLGHKVKHNDENLSKCVINLYDDLQRKKKAYDLCEEYLKKL